MANIIKPKRSNTAGNTPTTANLASGELGVNMADQKTYINNGTAVVQIGAGNLSGLGDVTLTSPTSGQSLQYNGTKWVNATGSGSGDVVGPASSTANALVRFNGTTGKLIKNGTITQDDTGNLSGILSETYDTVNAPPAIVEALEAWDSGNGTLEVGLKGGNVSYKYGQQEFVRAYNGSGTAMTKGQVVYIVGAQGNRVDVRLGLATSDATSAGTIGFVVESIANGAEGWVQVSGSLYKLDTSALTAGQALYLSPTTAGAYTTTKPTAPNHLVVLGWVERVSATVGSIYVKVDNGYELDELHNVLITSPTTGQQLVYNASTGVWGNSNTPTITGGSITLADGSFTLQDNTDPTKQARFELSSIGTGVTATYTLPPISSNLLNNSTTQTIDGVKTFSNATQNFGSSTATSTQNFAYGATISGATKTINFGTGGVAGSTTALNIGSTNGTTVSANGTWTFNTPLAATNMAQATTSTSGYLSSTDWNTFNNKWSSGTALSATTGSFSGVVTSTVATGTAPLSIASTTLNTNLNADLLDGNHASAFYLASNPSGYTNNTGTVTSVALSGGTTGLTVTGSPVTTSGTITLSGTLAVANGGTGKTTASEGLAALKGFATTATAAGTTTLTVSSAYQQFFTGTTTQTIVLPVTTTLTQGWSVDIINNSTGNLTVNSSGGNLVGTVLPSTSANISCITASGTTASSWDFDLNGFASATGSGSVVLSTSPTLTTPALGTPSAVVLTNATGTASNLTAGTATAANGLKSATTTVSVSAATAPSAGQVLTATNSTTATWQTPSAGSIVSKMIYDSFTATASQTTFTSSTTYTSGKIEVYANGVKMVNASDVTVTSGTSVVFASGLAVGTRVDLVYPI